MFEAKKYHEAVELLRTAVRPLPGRSPPTRPRSARPSPATRTGCARACRRSRRRSSSRRAWPRYQSDLAELLLAPGAQAARAQGGGGRAAPRPQRRARASRARRGWAPRTRSRLRRRRRPARAACKREGLRRARRPARRALPGPAFRCLLSPPGPPDEDHLQGRHRRGPQAQGQRGQPLRQPRAEPLRGRGRDGRPRRGRGGLQGRGRLHQRVRLPHRRGRGDHLALRPGREHLLRRQPPEDRDPLREPQGPGGHQGEDRVRGHGHHRGRRARGRRRRPTSATWATAASTSCATARSRQLTSDHSWVNEQIQSGVISADQARTPSAAQRGDARAGRQARPAGRHADAQGQGRATSCSCARTGSPP